jgi:5-methylcytosine-specific restriction protein B
MQEGDYVAVYNGPKSVRAMGVVRGGYEYKEAYEEYPHVRPVEWLDRSEHEIYQMNGAKNLTRKTLYSLTRVPLEDFLGLLPASAGDPEPHVLIIDEINRGNLSRIFGELVTLLESDKRKGEQNEMSVTLPYSQDRFSLPSNLYVLGTMNTADRSIALVDVALRRRFDFEEMMPDASVIRNQLTALLDEESEEIDLTSDQIDLIVGVFQVLNRRVSYLLDRDHQIGHSYFLEVESMTDLHEVWYSRVLPLLQEYFYNDRQRLVRVLGMHDPDEPMGFVKAGEQVQLLGNGSTFGEAGSWEFHNYGVGKLEAALRNTFSS